MNPILFDHRQISYPLSSWEFSTWTKQTEVIKSHQFWQVLAANQSDRGRTTSGHMATSQFLYNAEMYHGSKWHICRAYVTVFLLQESTLSSRAGIANWWFSKKNCLYLATKTFWRCRKETPYFHISLGDFVCNFIMKLAISGFQDFVWRTKQFLQPTKGAPEVQCIIYKRQGLYTCKNGTILYYVLSRLWMMGRHSGKELAWRDCCGVDWQVAATSFGNSLTLADTIRTGGEWGAGGKQLFLPRLSLETYLLAWPSIKINRAAVGAGRVPRATCRW